jgi:predicted LPLAT superfamily acyltransferase
MSAARWTRQAERGSPRVIRLMIWIIRNLGWHVAYAILTPVTVYFFVTSRRARSTSRDYLGRVLGREPSWGEIYRHCFTYAASNMDRVLFLSNRIAGYEIDVSGLDLLKRLIAEGRGGILLGAHFGNFDALRLIGRGSPVAVRPLMYRAEAGTLSVLLDDLDPKLKDSVIEIGTPDAMLQVRESLDRGEFVGILGDRTPADQKAIPVPFLGEEALFPTGPLTLAAALHVPVLLGYGVRTGRRRYEVGFKLFAEEIFLGRATRTEDLRHWIGLYAEWLESMCRRHPFNWFNFHDFWDKTIDSTPNR